MTSEMETLAGRLAERHEELWHLHMSALQLVTEGVSASVCAPLAAGLESLRAHLAETAPAALGALIEQTAEKLRRGALDEGEISDIFKLLEALVSLESGEGDALLQKLVAAGATAPLGGSPASEGPQLVDRLETADPDDVTAFATEAREHLHEVEADLIDLEKTHNLELVGEIFRAVHSVKGGAQYLGLEATATLAHRAEALLDRLRSRKLDLSAAVVSVLLRALDRLAALVENLASGTNLALDASEVVRELEAALSSGPKAPPADAATPADHVPPPEPDRPAPASVTAPHETIAQSLGDAELFAAEYQENVRSAASLLAHVDLLVGAPEEVVSVSRSLHSLKGLAGLVGVPEMERLAGALDAAVNRLARGGLSAPPGMQRTVDASVAALVDLFRQYQEEGRVSTSVDELVASLDDVTRVPPVPASGESVSAAEAPEPALAEGPLAARFREIVSAIGKGDAAAASRVVVEFARSARLQGSDEAAAAAEALETLWREPGSAGLQEGLARLRALLPSELPVAPRASESASDTSFEQAVLAIPGVGPKKVKRLLKAGLDSKEKVRAAGLPALIAIPGINIEQAKMLLDNCSDGARATEARATEARPAASGGPALPDVLERQVLDDQHDWPLASIYLSTTVRQLDAVQAKLRQRNLAAATTLLSDLVSAARYMRYEALVGALRGAADALQRVPPDADDCARVLSPLRLGLERLSRRLAQQASGTGSTGDAEIRELERMFAESSEAHLAGVGRRLPEFLAQMDESSLAALQHHLSCLHSAATNIGRDAVADAAGRLQSRVEELWLAPDQAAPARGEVLQLLQALFATCGLPAPSDGAAAEGGPGPVPPPAKTAVAASGALAPTEPASLLQSPAAPAPPRAASESRPASPAPVASEKTLAAPLSVENPVPDHALPLRASGSFEAQTADAGAEAGDAARPLVEAQTTVRVDTLKIDDLMNMVAELVVNRSAFMVLGTTMTELFTRLTALGRAGKLESRDLRTVLTRYDEAMTELGRVSNQLQQGVMRIRMIPVRTLFSRVPRLVRDLGLRENREVSVVFSGEDTELDKSVIERLSDPLVHLIRNAISHGIETAAERAAAGKPAEGRLLISARHQGNIVVIDVEDDGRGIDFDKIRRRWTESGLGTSAQAARLTPNELLATLFLPGFSTADKVTDVSGRGVGLDVVKRNIENLGGQVDAVTEPGRFSRFTIRIPLTMAIMQALLVRVAEETYAIPVSAVLQAERITRDRINSVENQKVITIRNSVIPLVELDQVFAYNYQLETGQSRGRTWEAAQGAEPAVSEAYVVVVQGEGREIGVVVNGLVGTQDIVIKSLEDELADGRGVAGASILGDGTVTLILDIGEIQKMVLDGQHSEEMRRSDTIRRLERYIHERGLHDGQQTVNQLSWPLEPQPAASRH